MRLPNNLLKYTHFKPTSKNQVLSSTIFLHGYLGSKKTFTKLSRHLTNTLQCQTYSLDLRNHGDSFHSVDVGYNAMTKDLEEFIHFHKNEIGSKVNLIGYSMGAKVALNFAFKNSKIVDKIVCIDNSPMDKYIPRELFNDILKIMKELNGLSHINDKTWKKITLNKIKKNLNNDEALSLYILDNFKFNKDQIELKIPSYILNERTLDLLGEFPKQSNKFPETVKTLFIKASESEFIDKKNLDELIKNFKLKEFEGTHHGILINHYKEIESLIEKFISSS